MAVLFDTLKLAERLEAAGMPARQARDVASALAESASGEVATRRDLELLRRDFGQDIALLRQDMAHLREYVDLRLAEMETRIKGEVRGWLMAQTFAIIGAVAAIVGLAAALTHLFR